jgi:hypothetical protein
MKNKNMTAGMPCQNLSATRNTIPNPEPSKKSDIKEKSAVAVPRGTTQIRKQMSHTTADSCLGFAVMKGVARQITADMRDERSGSLIASSATFPP